MLIDRHGWQRSRRSSRRGTHCRLTRRWRASSPRIVAALGADGRRMPILDALVAATALVEQIPVVTQDQDYDPIPGVEVIQV